MTHDFAVISLSDLLTPWEIIEKRLEAARYEVDKAARRYYQVEPENRLVARTLEKEWNDKLEQMVRLESEYDKIRRSPPFTISREQWHQVEPI